MIPRGIRWQVVERIDLNIMLDIKTGEVRLQQWIYWDILNGVPVCQGWTMHRNPDSFVERIGEYYYLRWARIKARSYCKYYTYHDPEVENHKVWPQAMRRIEKREEPARRKAPAPGGRLGKPRQRNWLRKLWS